MGSTKIRSLVKGIIWELGGVLLLWIITRNLYHSIFYIVIRILLYWIYERFWKKINWGKTK